MSWYREKAIAATRKAHTCEGCRTRIPAGQSAVYISCLSGYGDGPFYGHYHADCREAECALNKLHSCYHDDEWLPLHEIDPGDHGWLRHEYPVVAARKLGPVGAVA